MLHQCQGSIPVKFCENRQPLLLGYRMVFNLLSQLNPPMMREEIVFAWEITDSSLSHLRLPFPSNTNGWFYRCKNPMNTTSWLCGAREHHAQVVLTLNNQNALISAIGKIILRWQRAHSKVKWQQPYTHKGFSKIPFSVQKNSRINNYQCATLYIPFIWLPFLFFFFFLNSSFIWLP